MKRWLVLLAACGSSHGKKPDAPVAVIDAAVGDSAACVVPVTPDAPPASAAPSCTAMSLPGSCIAVGDCIESRTPTAGACAGSAGIECCTPRFADAIECDPNQHPQPNACLLEDAGDPGCPAGMAKIDTFCIDRYEAALVDDTGKPWSPYHNPAGHAVKAVSLRGAVPQGYISQVQAAAACAAAGKRLCSDTEWLRACQGPAMTTYPYGNTRQPGTCNDARAQHPAQQLYGTTASWIYSHLDSPCLNQEAAGLALTGGNPGCITAEGAFDMMGNLHEWTADPNGTFRGGYYVDTVLNGNGCLYATTAHATSYWDYSTGFRCCAAL
ncbi:MAG: SUMF1/EgtB/PvdO family nonheme iron enzyme [Deltaproteobacteria bacterium]|nr:SUMF1/EgtB/PvdO family nonheme iron enzyme [Deltaproteobacteria bacterium]